MELKILHIPNKKDQKNLKKAHSIQYFIILYNINRLFYILYIFKN